MKYYQAVAHLEDSALSKKLELFAKESVEYFTNKFGSEYLKQIEVLHDSSYMPLIEPKDNFDTEKYEIFVKLFQA